MSKVQMVNLKNPLVASYDIPGERQWCYSNPAPQGGCYLTPYHVDTISLL